MRAVALDLGRGRGDGAAMNAWSEVYALGGRQYGAVSMAQAQALGIARTTLLRRAATEGWERPHPAVLLLPGSASGALRAHSAACLAVGGPVALARSSAAFLHGATSAAPDIVQLVVPHGRRAPLLGGVDVLRSRTIDWTQVVEVRGFAVTSMARTVLDLAAVLDPDALRALVIKARQRRKVRLEDVATLLDRLGTVSGAARLRLILQQLDTELVDSVLERLVRQLLRRSGLQPHPHPYTLVLADGRTVHLDIAFPEYRVWIEVDGFTGHAEPADLDLSDRRQNAICALGWIPVRVTWLRYQNDKPGIVADVQHQIARQRLVVSAHGAQI